MNAHTSGHTYSFLGPRGTFCHAALRQVAQEPTDTFIPATDVPSALRKVRNGETDFAVVPIENSVEGGVNATLDSLVSGDPLEIYGEIVVPIAFALAVRPGTKLEDVHRISTHGHAWAQCRNWLSAHLTEAVHVPATSTAAAVKELATNPNADFDAAVCAVPTVEEYGMVSLSDEIADSKNAVTRFILVGKPDKISSPSGADKTTLMVQLPSDESGALLRMLEQFSARGVNMSRIESRPIGDTLGRYAFSIDALAHVTEERMQAVLVGLHRVSPQVIFLGSYPTADRKPTPLQQGTSNDEFARARNWVASITQRVEE
ncbi:prephenate dehydratase [Actinotignum urinale]|uniref:Prephenate dehydratase n=1 Tax=Actinotignum urinale TaxID=190146 RepID=A0ABU5G5J0_9ACTO|nr:prephenate dehydratase [Actinotignum urinale]MDY5132630.1 prephenate dehydratase [Actinotignum urinale]